MRRGTSNYGKAALSSEVAMVEQAAEGFRHMAIFAAACHIGELVAGREIDEELARSFLIDAGRSITGGRLTGAEVQRQVEQGLKRGKRKPRSAPTSGGRAVYSPNDAVLVVIDWWAGVQAQEWKGRSAGTTLRILAGFALLATASGRVRFDKSYRQVAEAAGVSVGTIAKHKSRWLPFVRQVQVGNRWARETDERSVSTVWQLVVRANGNSHSPPASEAFRLFPHARTLSDPAHNAWHRWSNGWRVYCLLSEESTTTTHLAEATGLHPGTIRRICARLVGLDAAERDADGWRVQPADSEELQHVGEDWAQKRRDRHRRERKKHRFWLAGLAERRQAEAERRRVQVDVSRPPDLQAAA